MILENRSMGRMGVIKGFQEETISKLILVLQMGGSGAEGEREKREFLLKGTETKVNYLSDTLCSLRDGVYQEMGLQK